MEARAGNAGPGFLIDRDGGMGLTLTARFVQRLARA